MVFWLHIVNSNEQRYYDYHNKTKNKSFKANLCLDDSTNLTDSVIIFLLILKI